MSGFAGMLKKNSALATEDLSIVENMAAAASHRGTCEKSTLCTERYAVSFYGYCEEKAQQPMSAHDGRYTGMFDGEIYNYPELRAELEEKGYTFKTESAIEVILSLYHEHGEKLPDHLRGMFAIIIFDNEKNTLFLARDPFGIKPLYYRAYDDSFVFASEMKSFLYCSNEKERFGFEPELLQYYLSYQYVLEPDTITGEVDILKAGHYILFDFENNLIEGIEQIPYSKLRFAPKKELSYVQKRENIRRAVESSLDFHMRGGQPIGTFLSGGIDSAIITGLASRRMPGIKAFTIAFGEREYSEVMEAAAIAARLDVEHIIFDRTHEDFIEAYEDCVYHLDSPVADPSAVAIYIACRETAKHVKTALSGEGADELFGGYRFYTDAKKTEKIARLPGILQKFMVSLAKKLPDGVKGKSLVLRAAIPLENRYIGNAFIFNEEEKKKILLTHDESLNFADLTRGIYADVSDESCMTKMQYCDINTWMRGDILVKGDRLSAAHCLEIRMPFLDKEVWKSASVLSDGDKLARGTTKYILRDAFRDIVDAPTVMRAKRGYPVPVRKWLRNELYGWAKEIISGSGAGEYINLGEALCMLDAHRDGLEDNYRTIWTILVFLTWHKLYVEEKRKNI